MLIEGVLAEEIKLLNGDSKKVCLGGFSQGAVMASNVGINYHKELGGLFLFSGFHLTANRPNVVTETMPIFVNHGDKDKIIDMTAAK